MAIQRVDTPLPDMKQMPHWFWQVFTRINGTALDGFLTFTSAGNGTIAAPSSGTTLLLNTAANSNALVTTDGTVVGQWAHVGTQLYIGTNTSHTFNLLSNGNTRVSITSTGNVSINAPTSGSGLTVSGASGAIAEIDLINSNNTASSKSAIYISVGGSSADDSYIRYNILSNTDWCAGIDNSDNDHFKFSKNSTLGTNDYWTILTTGGVRQDTVTVANLPAAGTVGNGTRYFVTDATATTFASVVAGGGANNVPVYSDGTNWRIG